MKSRSTIEAPETPTTAPATTWKQIAAQVGSDATACLFRGSPLLVLRTPDGREVRARDVDWRGVSKLIAQCFASDPVHPHDGVRRQWIASAYKANGMDPDADDA